jgi:ferredoxin
VKQGVQIANIGDLCNSCGNCDAFCPTSGAPHEVKPKLWLDPEGWREARGDAFHLERKDGAVALSARLGGRSHRLARLGDTAEYRGEKVRARFDSTTWTLLDWRSDGTLEEGETVDLSPCATLIALMQAEPALPASSAP